MASDLPRFKRIEIPGRKPQAFEKLLLKNFSMALTDEKQIIIAAINSIN